MSKKRRKRKAPTKKRVSKYPTSLSQTYIGRLSKGNKVTLVMLLIMGLAGLCLGVFILVSVFSGGMG